jgi:hypothetical protein
MLLIRRYEQSHGKEGVAIKASGLAIFYDKANEVV